MSDTEKIFKTVETYLRAIRTGSENDFRKAFYWNAVVINADGNNPVESTESIDEFMKKVQKRKAEGTTVEEIAHGVSVNQLAGAANVRVDFELVIGDKSLWGTDFFNMVKSGEEWKISQKIYAVTH
ncbi:hypothetical protein HN807_07850 [Candidatus Bathyarchaeota archaeon]|jgi:hypothetical protein|nr:hypothetical protein [Candidatus Bathyarchaeota archaeon]MBT4319568.1 hypothetical protein [Candidatus Bathyarchaeota archaeon]MBT4425128.1 hypothetical protein [Candidatus Bathyarchaeota archaeon]MBT5641632.1 hypothetical protein [Candidatus Bathyarchaeota archaeon]MBT6605905.1 hypothetical protein [Candidatus Bathyarchaeota archaeon]